MEWTTPVIIEGENTVEDIGPGKNYAQCGTCSLLKCSSAEEPIE